MPICMSPVCKIFMERIIHLEMVIREEECYIVLDMRALEQLRDEHKAVRTLLTLWKKIVIRMENGQEVNAEDLESLIAFMKGFVDRCHHQKEESYLFPALMELNVPEINKMVKELTKEHARLHTLVQEIDNSVEGFKKKDPRVKEKLVGYLKEYIGILSHHESEETDDLFIKADGDLTEETWGKLEKAFNKVEMERVGMGRHEEFHKLLDTIQQHYQN